MDGWVWGEEIEEGKSGKEEGRRMGRWCAVGDGRSVGLCCGMVAVEA